MHGTPGRFVIALTLALGAAALAPSSTRAATGDSAAAPPSPGTSPGASTGQAPSAAEDRIELSDAPYSEPGFGLSFYPPARTNFDQNTPEGALAQWTDPSDYVLSLSFKHTDQPVELKDVLKLAVTQFGFTHPAALVVQQGTFRAADRPGGAVYMKVPRDQQKGDPAWVLGQAFIKLDPNNLAVFQLRCPADHFEHARRVLEMVLVSAQLKSPAELDQQRQQEVHAGAELLKGITLKQMQDAHPADQLMRILDRKGRDVGYLRRTVAHLREMGAPGLEVQISENTRDGRARTDAYRKYFLADDGSSELWSVKATTRSARDRRAYTWAETGVRSGGLITVTRNTPTRRDEARHWQTPAVAYLAQVGIQLDTPLMIGHGSDTLAFYTYDPAQQDVVLRTVQVFKLDGKSPPLPDAVWRVDTRAAPDAPLSSAFYDQNRKLLRLYRADGKILVPTTADQLKKIWGSVMLQEQRADRNKK